MAVPKNKMSVAVWFDRARDCLCFASRLQDEQEYTAYDGKVKKFRAGDPIPEEFIVRIPLVDGEDFVEAVMNAPHAEGEEDLTKIVYGVQKLLDKRVADAISLSERLRLEWSKRVLGGLTGRNTNEVTVRADEWIKHQALREKVMEFFKDVRKSDGGHEASAAFLALSNFFEENGLDESRDLP